MSSMASHFDSRLRASHIDGFHPDSTAEPTVPRLACLFIAGFVVAVWTISLFAGFMWGLALICVMAYLVAAVGLISQPTVGLLGIGILFTVDAAARAYIFTGGLLRWNTPNYFMILVVILGLPILLRQVTVPMRIFQAFLLLLLVEVAISSEIKGGLDDVLALVPILGLVVFFERVKLSPESLHWFGIVSGITGAMAGLVHHLQASSFVQMNVNAWGHVPLTAMACICLAMRNTKDAKSIYFPLWVLALVNFMWVFLSGSRGNTLIGLCLILYATIVFRSAPSRIFTVVVATCIALIAVVFFQDQIEYSLGRHRMLLDANESISTRTSSRSDLLYEGWNMFLANPLGIGTGSYRVELSRMDAVRGITKFAGTDKSAHSAWIKILAENGVPGFVLLAMFVASFIVCGWWHRASGVFPIAALVSVAMATSFISNEFDACSDVWMLAAGVMVMLQQIRDTKQRETPRHRCATSPGDHSRVSWNA